MYSWPTIDVRTYDDVDMTFSLAEEVTVQLADDRQRQVFEGKRRTMEKLQDVEVILQPRHTKHFR